MGGTTDYLVVGAGATAMAFVDVMLDETDATFTIVDRRHAPGGHWNDAYPFVRLHAPSQLYGGPSLPLGSGRIEEAGFNRGLHELASGVEVVNHFHTLMRDRFLPSGRVTYLPLSEHVGAGEVVSLLSGERRQLEVARKLVDATRLETSIPLTHDRSFEVGPGVACVPPNDLPRLAPRHRSYAVLGGGKTALDSVLWLLGAGVPPDAVSWVVPRDPWLQDRSTIQPGREFFGRTAAAVAGQYEAAATATSIDDLAERLEASGNWMRVDPAVRPTMYHAATVSPLELEQLRRMRHVVRLGRVRSVDEGGLWLEQGRAALPPGTLYVDCTARALAGNVHDETPVFTPGQISLQMVRAYQPTFSAALIAHLEACADDDAEKQRLSRVTPMTDTVQDWASTMAASLANEAAWARSPVTRRWMAGCRLNAIGTTLAQVSADDAGDRALLGRVRSAIGPAIENLRRLAGSGARAGAAPATTPA